MIAGSDWISPTRVAGLLAYLVSFWACAARSIAGMRKGERSGAWLIVSGFQLGLVLDVAFDLRWKLHAYWMARAQSEGVYGERRWPQLLALVLLAGLLAIGCWLIWRRLRGRAGMALAATATLLSVGLWCCEALSYHYMDMILYAKAGGLMMVSFLWLSLAAVTCAGVWRDWQTQR